MTAFKILDWRPLVKNSLLGFTKVEMSSGMVISDVTVLNSGAMDLGPAHRASR